MKKTISIVLLLAFTLLTDFDAIAKENTLYFNIPKQSLDQALIAFSLRTNIIIIARPEKIKHLESKSIIGDFEVDDALLQMLSNNRLIAIPQNNGGYVIREKITTPEPPRDTPTITSPIRHIDEVFVYGFPFASKPSTPTKAATTFDNKMLEKYQLNSLGKIGAITPNFTPVSDGEGMTNLGIRGIKSFGTIEETTTPVTLHYNGAYLSPGETDTLFLLDLDEIEIQPTPNISGQGRGSAAGNINVISKKAQYSIPSTTFQYGAGTYNTRSAQFISNIPYGDSFALRLAGAYDAHDGYTRNISNYPLENRNSFDFIKAANNEDQDNLKRHALRLSARLNPTNTTTISAFYDKHKNTSDPTAFLDPFYIEKYERAVVTDSDVDNNSSLTISGINIQYNNTKTAFSYSYNQSQFSRHYTLDVDFGRGDTFQEFRTEKYESVKRSHNLEIYPASSATKNYWLIGFRAETTHHFSITSNDTYQQPPNQPANATGFVLINSYKDNDIYDAYMLLGRNISSATQLFAELRATTNTISASPGRVGFCNQNLYSPKKNSLSINNPYYTSALYNIDVNDEIINIDGNPCSAFTFDGIKVKSKPISYRMGIDLALSPTLSSNVSYSKGARPESDHQISDAWQSSQNFEASLIGDLLSKTFTFQLTAFNNIHKNMLVPWGDDDEISAVTRGLEWQNTYMISDNSQLDLSAAYLYTRIGSVERVDSIFPDNNDWNPPSNDPDKASAGVKQLDGNQLPYAPKWTATLRHIHAFEYLQHRFESTLEISAYDDYYLDIYNRENATITQPEHEEFTIRSLSKQDGQVNLNANIEWTPMRGPLSFMLSARNITNNDKRTYIREGYYGPSGFSSSYASPRTIVIYANLEF
ncbi:hypothetical protein [Marinagarivorans cellulosilyticus]|uniref:Iron complex outermembrane recepter protein n=1 Tax=Marinagarivorans cellulosilyticus TaxID=2721545 RepID=A0AAN1WLC3_9GAMM|nr:hypothetical protein [Marinagarivorans cellulosilyticus]BCD99699.1 iron complex outermembrane recepter protein [Marinagarivorans cellulosilyticus]